MLFKEMWICNCYTIGSQNIDNIKSSFDQWENYVKALDFCSGINETTTHVTNPNEDPSQVFMQPYAQFTRLGYF